MRAIQRMHTPDRGSLLRTLDMVPFGDDFPACKYLLGWLSERVILVFTCPHNGIDS